MQVYHRVMRPKDEDGTPNSVDPDPTAPGDCLFFVFCFFCFVFFWGGGLHCLLRPVYPTTSLPAV